MLVGSFQRERLKSLDRNDASNDELFFTSNVGTRSSEQCLFEASAINFTNCFVMVGWNVSKIEPTRSVKTGGGAPLAVTLICSIVS